MAEPSLTARHALAIPHILDLVIGYVARDCLHRLLQPCRLVCKAWDQAAMRQLFGSNRINISNIVCSSEVCLREGCYTDVPLDAIMRNRPWVLLFVKAVHLQFSAQAGSRLNGELGATSHILQQCKSLRSIRTGGTFSKVPIGCIPSTIRHLDFFVPSKEEDVIPWKDLLARLPQLSHLGVRLESGSRTLGFLSGILAAPKRALVAIVVDVAMGDPAEIMAAITPHFRHLRRLELITLIELPIAFLDSLPRSLEQLRLPMTTLVREVILRLADATFLPQLVIVPEIGWSFGSRNLPVNKTEVQAAIAGLLQRGTVRDMHTAGFKLYWFASDLSSSDRARLQECAKKGTAFEPSD